MANTSRIATTSERLQRILQMKDEERLKEEESEEAKKNKNFAQIYNEGWEKMREFIDDNQPTALKLYTFLAQHMDANTGAIVASHAILAERMNVSTKTIKTVLNYLEKKEAVIRINLGKGTVQAYCLNPELVWKSFDNKKQYAAFNTKTLARKEDNGDVIRKLKVMMHGDKSDLQTELEFEEDNFRK